LRSRCLLKLRKSPFLASPFCLPSATMRLSINQSIQPVRSSSHRSTMIRSLSSISTGTPDTASMASLPSTPKREISWKELSVILKSGEKENRRSSKQKLPDESREKVVDDREPPSLARAPLASPSRSSKSLTKAPLASPSSSKSLVRAPQASPSSQASKSYMYDFRNATFQSPGRIVRRRQSRVALKMLESISPDVLLNKNKMVRQRSSATIGSPAVPKRSRSGIHRTPPRAPTSERKRRLSQCVASPSFRGMSPKTPRSLAILRNSLNQTSSPRASSPRQQFDFR
jgi:hypothetical protein